MRKLSYFGAYDFSQAKNCVRGAVRRSARFRIVASRGGSPPVSAGYAEAMSRACRGGRAGIVTRVGFVWEALAGWTGGSNYLRSLLSAILADEERTVEPLLFADQASVAGLRRELPALEVIASPFLARATPAWYFRKAWQRLSGTDACIGRLLRRHGVQLLSHSGSLGARGYPPSLAWVVDLQHRRLPRYFAPAELQRRDLTFRRWQQECAGLLFSSRCAFDDFRHCYPDGDSRAFVVPFVPDTRPQEPAVVAGVLARHRLSSPYFHVPNQFWRHKNHELVIEAAALLVARNVGATVVFTGAAGPNGDVEHYESLLAKAAPLGEAVRFLGFLPYVEVTALMQGATAIINPSRFEGWSTTVEEARNLGKSVLLSDIDVHREQSPPDARYFDTDNPGLLAELMESALARPMPCESPDGLSAHIRARRMAFARSYQDAVAGALAAPGTD